MDLLVPYELTHAHIMVAFARLSHIYKLNREGASRRIFTSKYLSWIRNHFKNEKNNNVPLTSS